MASELASVRRACRHALRKSSDVLVTRQTSTFQLYDDCRNARDGHDMHAVSSAGRFLTPTGTVMQPKRRRCILATRELRQLSHCFNFCMPLELSVRTRRLVCVQKAVQGTPKLTARNRAGCLRSLHMLTHSGTAIARRTEVMSAQCLCAGGAEGLGLVLQPCLQALTSDDRPPQPLTLAGHARAALHLQPARVQHHWAAPMIYDAARQMQHWGRA